MENSKSATTKSAVSSSSKTDLMCWNMDKVVENEPNIDLRVELRRLKASIADGCPLARQMIQQSSTERHMYCAILAWQALGNNDIDALVDTYMHHVEKKQNELESSPQSKFAKKIIEPKKVSFQSKSTAETVWMRQTDIPQSSNQYQKVAAAMALTVIHDNPLAENLQTRKPEEISNEDNGMKTDNCHSSTKNHENKEVLNYRMDQDADAPNYPRISVPGYLKNGYADEFESLEKTTSELRKRLERLMCSEVERMALVEGAEANWHETEAAYERRLNEECLQEDLLINKLNSLITERNELKKRSEEISNVIKEREEQNREDSKTLQSLEDKVVEKNRERERYFADVTAAETALTEATNRLAQVEQEMKVSVENHRKLETGVLNELFNIQTSTLNIERTLRDEITSVNQETDKILRELEEIQRSNDIKRKQLTEVIKRRDEAFNVFKIRKQERNSELVKLMEEIELKREELGKFEQVILKKRIDKSIYATRTASRILLSRDNKPKFCSQDIISHLLDILFDGLMEQAHESSNNMPCKFLSCFGESGNDSDYEELKNYILHNFQNELDIAISLSMEGESLKLFKRIITEKFKDKERMKVDKEVSVQENIQLVQTDSSMRFPKLRKNPIFRAEIVHDVLDREMSVDNSKIQLKASDPVQKQKFDQHTSARLNIGYSRSENNLKMQFQKLREEIVKKDDLAVMETKLTKLIRRLFTKTSAQQKSNPESIHLIPETTSISSHSFRSLIRKNVQFDVSHEKVSRNLFHEDKINKVSQGRLQIKKKVLIIPKAQECKLVTGMIHFDQNRYNSTPKNVNNKHNIKEYVEKLILDSIHNEISPKIEEETNEQLQSEDNETNTSMSFNDSEINESELCQACKRDTIQRRQEKSSLRENEKLPEINPSSETKINLTQIQTNMTFKKGTVVDHNSKRKRTPTQGKNIKKSLSLGNPNYSLIRDMPLKPSSTSIRLTGRYAMRSKGHLLLQNAIDAKLEKINARNNFLSSKSDNQSLFKPLQGSMTRNSSKESGYNIQNRVYLNKSNPDQALQSTTVTTIAETDHFKKQTEGLDAETFRMLYDYLKKNAPRVVDISELMKNENRRIVRKIQFSMSSIIENLYEDFLLLQKLYKSDEKLVSPTAKDIIMLLRNHLRSQQIARGSKYKGFVTKKECWDFVISLTEIRNLIKILLDSMQKSERKFDSKVGLKMGVSNRKFNSYNMIQ